MDKVRVIEQKDLSQARWYVVRSATGYEKQVKRSLSELIILRNMQTHFEEILVPTENILEMRQGKKCRSQRKFFPGYVLVKMLMSDESWHLVSSVPKVLGFVGGTREKPTPLSHQEVEQLMRRIESASDAPRPSVLYEAGEMVRVVDGPFSDFNGVVEGVNYEKSRLRVAVLIFGRSTPVELDFSQVEKT